MKYSSDEITGYFSEILANNILPNTSSCEVLRKNITDLMSNITDIVKENWPDIGPNFDLQREAFIHLYSSEKTVFFEKYSINENNPDVMFWLEINAVTYLIAAIAKGFGVKSLEISKKLKKIEDLSKRLMSEINSFDVTSKFTLSAAFIVEDVVSLEKARKDSTEEEMLKLAEGMRPNLFPLRFVKFQESLEFSLSIHERLARTLIGETLQFGVRGPKTNSALDVWIEYMVELWAIGLDRSISNSENKYEGREQFLRFLEDCMYPLHEEIEADTIRNAFEKLREKGEFEHLSKK